jgi:hypothetical protein
MNASSFSKREVSRVKHKVRWLTLGLITRTSIICCRKGDHTRGNSPDPTVLILNSVNTCWPSVLLDLPISNKFYFQFSVVLFLVTTKFISKEFIQFKSCTISVHTLEHCWLGDFVRGKNMQRFDRGKKHLESKCIYRRIMINWISFQMNERIWTWLICLWHGFVWTGEISMRVKKMPGISWLVVDQLPSQEGLY